MGKIKVNHRFGRQALLTVLLSVALTSAALAQATFQPVWKGDFDNKANFLKYAATNGSQVIGTTRSEVCVLNGEDGKVLWSAKLSDIANVKKTDIQKYMEDAGALFVYDKRMGKDVMICIDTKTGKELWENSDFENVRLSSIIYMADLKAFAIVIKTGLVMVDARSGKYLWTINRFKGSIAYWTYDSKNGKLVLVNFKTGFGALLNGFENQLMQIDARSGNVDWVTSYEGIVETKLNTGEPLVSTVVTDDKVVLMLAGLEVFDRKTGNLIWKTHYDVSLNKGLAGSAQMYDAVADPLIAGNYVYVANFSSFSKKKVLQKFDLNTGKMIWESDKIDGRKTIIPRLAMVGNTVVIQVGGYVNLQGEQQSNGQTIYYSKWKWQGPFGLQGFDGNTGELKWQSDKFKSRITNIASGDGKIYVADEKYVYGIDPSTGESKVKTSLKKAKTGPAMEVFSYKDKIVVLSENGISAYAMTDGSKQYAFKAKGTNMNSEFIGDNYFLHSEKVLVCINLDNGIEKGHYKYIKGASWNATTDGEYFFVMSKKGVSKYKVN